MSYFAVFDAVYQGVTSKNEQKTSEELVDFSQIAIDFEISPKQIWSKMLIVSSIDL